MFLSVVFCNDILHSPCLSSENSIPVSYYSDCLLLKLSLLSSAPNLYFLLIQSAVMSVPSNNNFLPQLLPISAIPSWEHCSENFTYTSSSKPVLSSSYKHATSPHCHLSIKFSSR